MIPKVINQVWFGREGKDPFVIPLYKNCAEHNEKFLENFELKLWTKDDCYKLVEEYFPQYKQKFNSLFKDILRMDIIRYMIMYVHGGFYYDHDIQLKKNMINNLNHKALFVTEIILSKKSCENVAKNNLIRCGVPEDEIRVANYFMGSEPGHNIWLVLLKEVFERIDKNPQCITETTSKIPVSQYDILYLTGPDAITHIVNRYDSKEITLLNLQQSRSFVQHLASGTWRKDLPNNINK